MMSASPTGGQMMAKKKPKKIVFKPIDKLIEQLLPNPFGGK